MVRPILHHVPPPARKQRRYNLRRIKATWPYTVQEIADLFGIHKNAVLRWLPQGLHADRTGRPFLIRGDDLVRFLDHRQNSNRRRCAPDEFFCFRCRAPRAAYLRMVDVVIETPARLRLTALCAVCDTTVNKVQSIGELAKTKERFNVQQLTGEHLIERPFASLNCEIGVSNESASQ